MRKALVCILAVAVVGCQQQCPFPTMNQYPPAYLAALEAARAVMTRHFGGATVDKVHGLVESSSVVRANLSSKFRTRAVAKVFPTGPERYDVEIRVTNDLEVSEPTSLGGPWNSQDWRAVGFDHLAEAVMNTEVAAQLQGQTVTVPPAAVRSYLMFPPAAPTIPMRHRDLLKPNIPDPVRPPQPAPKAPEPAPKPTTEAPKPLRAADLYEQHLALGDDHWRRRDLDNALLEYQRAAVAAPQNPVAHLALAGVWTALRRYNAGATALREAAAAANGQPVPGTALARLRGPAEELSERLLLLKGLCKQQPNDRDGRLLLAYHYILAGRADDARASLDEAMRADPNDAAARFLAQQLGPARS